MEDYFQGGVNLIHLTRCWRDSQLQLKHALDSQLRLSIQHLFLAGKLKFERGRLPVPRVLPLHGSNVDWP